MKNALVGVGVLSALGAAGVVARVRSSRTAVPALVSPNAKRVVVLGAGFGGMSAARTLATQKDGEDLDVLLVDRQNFHLFTPILYQVATGGVTPDNVAHPIRYVARNKGFRFQESTVESIDVENRQVHTDDGAIPYDYLVVAVGSTTNFFGIDAVQEHSLTLKTLGDGIGIRNRVLDALERADVEQDPEARRALLTFVIVGAGYTGVELGSSLRDLLMTVLLKDYPTIRPEEIRVMLVEAVGRVMTGFDDSLVESATKTMREKGVEIRLNTPVNRVEPEGVYTADGELIPSATVIWTAGVRANALIGDLPGQKGRDGRVSVNDCLQVEGHENIFVIGDSAAYVMPGEERPLPANAPIAIAAGKTAGKNVLHALRGEPLEPLKYRREGQLVALGRNNAVVELFGKVKVTGLLGWFMWRAVYFYKLTGVKNQLGVLLDWAFGLAGTRETNTLRTR